MVQHLTPSQTIGPFFFGTLTKQYHAVLAPGDVAGEHLDLAVILHDAAGAIVPDAVVELWQANSHGRYNHPEDLRNLSLDEGFTGYGRASADSSGRALFSTVKPGLVPWPTGGMQAPHVNISIFARGVLNRLATRAYFDGDPANVEDPVLRMLPPSRRAGLLAKRDDAGVWLLNVFLGGDQETVFFEV